MPAVRVQFRRGTASQWYSSNPVLALAEIGVETDTRQLKIGDGFTPWQQLPYGGIQGPACPGSGPVNKLSASAISGSHAVRFTDAGHVAIASADVPQHARQIAGVAINAVGAAEQPVQIMRFGEFTDSAWDWAPMQPVFLGTAGLLTQTHSQAWAFSLIVGVAVSATTIALDFSEPVFHG